MIANLSFLADATFDDQSGDVVLTRRDNTTITFNVYDAALAKNFYYDSATEELVFVRADDSEVRVPVSQFIHEYSGNTGTQIQIAIGTNNEIQATLRIGTVTRRHLNTDVQDSLTRADNAEPAFSKNTAFNRNFGNAAGTVCEGNDTRLNDARMPLGHTLPIHGNIWNGYTYTTTYCRSECGN